MQTAETITKEQILNALESMGVTMSATFIPQQYQSPKKRDDTHSMKINHAVTVMRNGRSLSTEYHQGIAHHPNYVTGEWSSFYWEHFLPLLNTGKQIGIKIMDLRHPALARHAAADLAPPSIVDVVWSLLVDSSGDFSSFENWAGDYGYDTDSREAERIFTACRDTKLKLETLFTASELEQLHELYQDYITACRLGPAASSNTNDR